MDEPLEAGKAVFTLTCMLIDIREAIHCPLELNAQCKVAATPVDPELNIHC